MTNTSISAAWYPLGALIALLLVVAALAILNRSWSGTSIRNRITSWRKPAPKRTPSFVINTATGEDIKQTSSNVKRTDRRSSRKWTLGLRNRDKHLDEEDHVVTLRAITETLAHAQETLQEKSS